jgi:transposase
LGAPKDLSDARRFFLQPSNPRHRQYEALRAYFVEGQPSAAVARAFGYSVGSLRVMCHHFRRDPDPTFFLSPKRGPRDQPKKDVARELLISLRKQNYSVYEISQALKERDCPLSPTAVREVLKEEGFAPLPRRLDEERPNQPRALQEPIADVRDFSLEPRSFTSRCAGLFLFIPELVRLDVDRLARATQLPGSKMIPASHALRACLALKLWSIERKSHIMSLVTDEGLALFSGLNSTPKKSYLSEYSSRISHTKTTQVLAAWHERLSGAGSGDLFTGESFNLDFHSVPHYGESETIERHYVSARSRRQPSVLVFLAQDATGHAFCYSNADLRKGEEAEEVFQFISFWKRTHGELPRHLVFDSRLTTYANLARLDKMGISFITLRRRSPKLLKEIVLLPRSAWRTVELDVPTRRYKHPRVFEQKVKLAGRTFRQFYILDLGHEDPPTPFASSTWTPCPRAWG